MSEHLKDVLDGNWAKMAPELCVSNIKSSLVFWCDLCGFSIAYDRLENGFAYLNRDGAQFMLDEVTSDGGCWSVGVLKKPYGRGVNFQIEVSSVKPIIEALEKASWPLFKDVHDEWYRVGEVEMGCRQFLVQDPDGYLLRFSEDLGNRPVEK